MEYGKSVDDHRINQQFGNRLVRSSMQQQRLSIKPSGQRVAVLIDVQNLYYGAKDIYNTKVAYNKFLDMVVNGRQLVKSIAYVSNRNGNNQSSFIGLLKGIGCDVKQKNAIEHDGHFKCNWDVEIAIDAIMLAPKVDALIVASGDGNFACLLKTLKSLGVRAEVASFKQNTATSLIDESDKFIDINKNMLIEADKAWAKKVVEQGGDGFNDDKLAPLHSALVGEESEPKAYSVDGDDEGEVDDDDTGEYEEPDYDQQSK